MAEETKKRKKKNSFKFKVLINKNTKNGQKGVNDVAAIIFLLGVVLHSRTSFKYCINLKPKI